VLLLLGAVVCVASVPPVDDPDTAVDESDVPVILATPEPLIIKSVPPLSNSVDPPILASYSRESRADLSRYEFMPMSKQSGSYSSQILLCTLLI